jgi:PAS domain S-box-containing protein
LGKKNKPEVNNDQNVPCVEEGKIIAIKTSASNPVANRKLNTVLFQELQVHQVELEMQNKELRNSQEALAKERFKFKSLFNFAPVGYFILSTSGMIEEVNEKALSLLKKDKTSLIKRRFQNYLAKEDQERFLSFFYTVKNYSGSRSVECKIENGSGAFFAQIEGVAVTECNSENRKIYLALIDITDKKTALINQNEAKEKLEMALSASSTGTWSINFTSEQIILGRHARQIIGLAEEVNVLSMKSFINLVYPDDRKTVNKKLNKLSANKNNLDMVFRIDTSGGTVKYIEAKGHFISPESGGEYFAGLVTDITERRRLENEALELKLDEQKRILKAIVDTQENERKRISLDLHHSVGQLLYVTKLYLEQLGKGKSGADQLSKSKHFLDESIKEMRNISFQLSPTILSDFGLLIALEEMIKRVPSDNLSIVTTFKGLTRRFSSSVEIDVFRMVQELLNNVIKHSGATNANIKVLKTKGLIEVVVEDDGVGFNPDTIADGFGIYSIKNRLSLYIGNINIESAKDKGTKISIKLFC